MERRLAREGFDLDLEAGEAREDAFQSVLQDANIRYVEHKSDEKAQVTGNFFCEIRQGSTTLGQGRPSGLSTSKSDLYAIEIMPSRWILITTDDLKTLARNYYRLPGHRTMGGDNYRYEGVLIPLEAFVRRWRPVG